MSLTNAFIFYAIGAVLFGAVFASMETVEGEWRAKPLPYPRLIGFLVAGSLWPIVLIQMLFRR